jgi:hypothetical protein
MRCHRLCKRNHPGWHRFCNTGTCTWNSSYAIVFDHGDALSAPAAVPFPGIVAPGQEVDLSINMIAPAGAGTYTSFWKFRNASGIIFVTNPFSAKINVVVPTITPTSGGIIIPVIPIIPILLLPYTTQVMLQVSVPAGSVGSSTAACPGSSIVTGGGFAVSNDMVLYTHSQSGNNWQVYSNNLSGSSQPLNGYATCLYYSGGTTSMVYAQATAPAFDIGHATVACPSGSVVTGGGYASNTDFVVYNSSMADNGWQVYAQNNSSSGQILNAYATCLAGTAGTTSQVLAQKSIAGGAYDGTTVSCPSGSLLTGGGFAANTTMWVYNTSMNSSDSKTWMVYAKNLAGGSQTLNAYAVCLTLP